MTEENQTTTIVQTKGDWLPGLGEELTVSDIKVLQASPEQSRVLSVGKGYWILYRQWADIFIPTVLPYSSSN